MTQTAAFWSRIAPRYARKPVPDQAAYEATLARTTAYLHREDRVLELGCGTGSTALKLAPFTGSIVAVDYAEGMIDIAREKLWSESLRNVEFRVAEPGSDALQGEVFDVVAAFNLFHLLPDPAATLAHVARYLKPGGTFISKTPCLGGLGAKTVAFKTMVGTMRLVRMAPPVTFLSAADWAGSIRAAGFEIVERDTYPNGSYNRFIVARKRG